MQAREWCEGQGEAERKREEEEEEEKEGEEKEVGCKNFVSSHFKVLEVQVF